jgi:hypothetical protein
LLPNVGVRGKEESAAFHKQQLHQCRSKNLVEELEQQCRARGMAMDLQEHFYGGRGEVLGFWVKQ